MKMVRLMFDTCHRAVRVRLVLGLIATAVIVAAAVAPAAADKMDDSPDLVLYDGKISTVDANNSTVEAIAIRDGTIIARGGLCVFAGNNPKFGCGFAALGTSRSRENRVLRGTVSSSQTV